MIVMGLPLHDVVSAPVVKDYVSEVVRVAHPERATAGVLQDSGDLPSADHALGSAVRYELAEREFVAKSHDQIVRAVSRAVASRGQGSLERQLLRVRRARSAPAEGVIHSGDVFGKRVGDQEIHTAGQTLIHFYLQGIVIALPH